MTEQKLRLLIVGRTRYDLPLDQSLARKFAALARHFDLRVLAGAGATNAHDPTFRLVRRVRPAPLDAALFHFLLPLRIGRELRAFAPDAVLVQGAHEAAIALVALRLAHSRAALLVDVHGDWRAAPRLYGSSARRLLARFADRLAVAALRRADAVRTVSRFTSARVREAGVEPAAEFAAFIDVESLLEREPVPLPESPVALFVGVLERYKDVDGLAAAWRDVAARVPNAELRIVGDGSRARVVRRLERDIPGRVTWTRRLPPEQIASALDAATCLVLPSPLEGMGRVIVEAFCRGRPVVGALAGGIPELVVHGQNGLLVAPHDARALADALVRLLAGGEAERFGAAARAAAERGAVGADAYARSLAAVVAVAVGRRAGAAGSPVRRAGRERSVAP